jgi:hypothetical protein
MQPWTEASGNDRWALREPGKQMLIYSGHGAPAELDLSAETGTYRVNVVNERTGQVTPGETVTVGKHVQLPTASVLWLVKAN